MDRFEDIDNLVFTKLINEHKKLIIPNFQRPFSWKKTQILEFLSSVLENEQPYYVGSIVCLKAYPEKYDNRLVIVDGQQRLTTLSLLISALINRYEELKTTNLYDEGRIDNQIIQLKEYLMNRDRDVYPNVEYTVLKLGRDDYQQTFEHIVMTYPDDIQTAGLNEVQKRLANGYLTLRESLTKLIEEDSNDDDLATLNEISRKCLNVEFICIVLRSENDIHKIFEGMNSTGLGLNVADLIKSAVIGASTNSELSQEIETLWDELESLFIDYDISLFPKFIRHHWISRNGYISGDKLYEEVKKKKIEGRSGEFIKDYLEELLRDARFYLGIRRYSLAKIDTGIAHESLVSLFEAFGSLNNDQMYELLLTYYHLNLEKEFVTKRSLENALFRLWMFVFRSRFVSVNPSDYERKFAILCEKLESEITSAQEFNDLIQAKFNELQNLVKDSDQFIKTFAEEVKYTDRDKDKRFIRIIFGLLFAENDSTIRINGKPEIEHILPQSPQEWGLTKSQIKNHVNRIGNLTLLHAEDNRDADNKPMAYKVERVFLSSHFELNRSLAEWASEFEQNFENAIENRSNELATNLNRISLSNRINPNALVCASSFNKS